MYKYTVYTRVYIKKNIRIVKRRNTNRMQTLNPPLYCCLEGFNSDYEEIDKFS